MTAFICGSINDWFLKNTDFSKIQNIVISIIQKNNIDKIFFCKRNSFDDLFFSVFSTGTIEKIDVILLSDIYKAQCYSFPNIKTLCPYNNAIDNQHLYRTLYSFAIKKSDFMITGYKTDDDISAFIKEQAEQNNIRIIDFYSYI